jgi:hypothetical protein
MIAGRAVNNVGRKGVGGQASRKENMVDPGTVVGGGVVEGEVMLSSTSQGAVKKGGGDERSEGQPTVRAVQSRGPVLRRVRTAVPIPDKESGLVKVGGRKIVEIGDAVHTSSRGIHVRDNKCAATDRHLSLDDTTIIRI